MYYRFDVYWLGNEVDRWYIAVVDLDLQKRGGGGGGGQSPQKIFSALRASFWSKNKRGVLGCPPVPWTHHWCIHLEMRMIDGIFGIFWKWDCMSNRPLINLFSRQSRLAWTKQNGIHGYLKAWAKAEFLAKTERKKCKNEQNICLMDVIYFSRSNCKKKYLFMSKNKALSVCIVKFILTYNHQFLLLLYHTPDWKVWFLSQSVLTHLVAFLYHV